MQVTCLHDDMDSNMNSSRYNRSKIWIKTASVFLGRVTLSTNWTSTHIWITLSDTLWTEPHSRNREMENSCGLFLNGSWPIFDNVKWYQLAHRYFFTSGNNNLVTTMPSDPSCAANVYPMLCFWKILVEVHPNGNDAS